MDLRNAGSMTKNIILQELYTVGLVKYITLRLTCTHCWIFGFNISHLNTLMNLHLNPQTYGVSYYLISYKYVSFLLEATPFVQLPKGTVYTVHFETKSR